MSVDLGEIHGHGVADFLQANACSTVAEEEGEMNLNEREEEVKWEKVCQKSAESVKKWEIPLISDEFFVSLQM